MQSSALDDVPHLVRARLSPTPNHYSIATNTQSPSPHDRKVMSPNLLGTTSHNSNSRSRASARRQLCDHEGHDPGRVAADFLRSFTTSISDDLSFAADIQAALSSWHPEYSAAPRSRRLVKSGVNAVNWPEAWKESTAIATSEKYHPVFGGSQEHEQK